MASRVLTLKEFVGFAQKRRENKFDMNLAVSGSRGNGKSTFLFKFFNRFPEFRPRTHIVYRRKDVMDLLEKNKYGCIMDDEAIRTGYKRNFFETDQKLLVQMMNMYRDNFNIYGMAIPNFYSLDKGVRDLIKFHVNIIDRGVGVVHMAQQNIYSDDMWDVNYNRKVEERWGERKRKNPNFKAPYHKLSTFYAYIKFADITKKQRELYEEIKAKKRKEVYDDEMSKENSKEEDFYEKLIKKLLNKELTQDLLLQLCLFTGKKYYSVRDVLNKKLKERGINNRVKELLLGEVRTIHSSQNEAILKNKMRLPVI